MNDVPNMQRLRGTIEVLRTVSPEGQMLALRNLATDNGGRYDLPSERLGADGQPVYMPLLLSVSVFGVYAMSDNIDELPKNWILAATNILEADETGAAA